MNATEGLCKAKVISASLLKRKMSMYLTPLACPQQSKSRSPSTLKNNRPNSSLIGSLTGILNKLPYGAPEIKKRSSCSRINHKLLRRKSTLQQWIQSICQISRIRWYSENSPWCLHIAKNNRWLQIQKISLNKSEWTTWIGSQRRHKSSDYLRWTKSRTIATQKKLVQSQIRRTKHL